MTRTQRFTPTRRTLLSVIGTGIATGLGGTSVAARDQSESGYVLVQGDRCVPVEPLRGQDPVEAFYGYQLPGKYVGPANGASTGAGPSYASAGTVDLQRAQTSIAFLYRGPEKLSLVVVHGSIQASDGGSVTFRISGLPESGQWVVKDDLYHNPDTGTKVSSNYDRWQVGGTDHRIDWTWGTTGTDGGAFAGLGDDFSVVVDPAFNQAAALYNQYYEGTVTDWVFLSGSRENPGSISLDMSQPLRLATGSCESAGERERETGDEEMDEIVFESVTDARFEYRVSVTGEIRRDEWTEPDDVILNGNMARGGCEGGGVDDYLFSGEIDDLSVSGPGKVLVNGELRRDTT